MKLEGLKSVIIDNSFEEVKGLISALNKKGIGCNFYPNKESFPENPLKGIRIVFLDFELGFSEDVETKTKVSEIQNYLKNIISDDNGPYILVIWAKDSLVDYDELIEILEERILKFHGATPLIIARDFNKLDIKDEPDKILDKIGEILALGKMGNVLLQWELLGHEALNKTIQNFVGKPSGFQNIASFTEYLENKLKRDFRQFLNLELGKNNPSGLETIHLPQHLLNDFFKEKADSLMSSFKDYPDSLMKEIKEFSELNYSLEEKAELNKIFSLNFNGTFEGLKPGNIYDFEEICSNDEEFSLVDTLKKDILNEYISNVNSLDENIYSKSKIIALELTPNCDFSQKNHKNLRFLLGVFIPKDYIKYLKGYSYKGGKIKIETKGLKDSQYKPLLVSDDKGEVHYISFNALYFKTFSFDEIKNKPLFSLRKPFFSDVQHWFSKHSSRLGKIEFN